LTGYVALLRAVNVGGTGKLPMTALAQMCEAVGFEKVKTYIASGNVVFQTGRSEDQVRSVMEDQLQAYAGKSVGIIVRTAAEIADTLARNPFVGAPGNRVMPLFVDGALPSDPLYASGECRGHYFFWRRRSLMISSRFSTPKSEKAAVLFPSGA
jgi:uncharacterized protein (DUF1697 family)